MDTRNLSIRREFSSLDKRISGTVCAVIQLTSVPSEHLPQGEFGVVFNIAWENEKGQIGITTRIQSPPIRTQKYCIKAMEAIVADPSQLEDIASDTVQAPVSLSGAFIEVVRDDGDHEFATDNNPSENGPGE